MSTQIKIIFAGGRRMEKHVVRLRCIQIMLIGILAFVFLVIGANFNGELIQKFDYFWINMIQGNISEKLTSFMLFITFWGSIKGVALISAVTVIWLFVSGKRLLSIATALTISIGAGGVNHVLKLYYRRERPSIHPIIHEQGYSFPSGHSMGSMILFGCLVFIFFKVCKKRSLKLFFTVICIVMILIIGISRIYLGVHYPSDVLGGYTAGAIWLLISIIIFSFFENRLKRRQAIN